MSQNLNKHARRIWCSSTPREYKHYDRKSREINIWVSLKSTEPNLVFVFERKISIKRKGTACLLSIGIASPQNISRERKCYNVEYKCHIQLTVPQQTDFKHFYCII